MVKPIYTPPAPQPPATVFETGTTYDRAFAIIGLLNGGEGTQQMGFKMTSRKGSDTVEIKVSADVSLKPILGHLERREISVAIDDEITIITVM